MSTIEDLPPHAPVVGRMRHFLGSFHFSGLFWYRLHHWGVSVLPGWAIGFFIAIFTTIFFFALHQIRRAIISNLEVVLGPATFWQDQRRAYRTLWNFAWCLSERYEMLATDRRATAEIEGEEIWRQQAAGLILTTAHIGHWEVGAMLAPDHEDRMVNVVREEEMNPQAQRFLRQLFDQRERAGAGFIFHFAHRDPMLGPKMLAALRRGEIVALQSDRPRAGGRSVPAELFGHPFEIPAGPIAMARAAGVPLLPVFVFRHGRLRSRVVFRDPIQVPRSKHRREDFAEAARRLATEVEWAISQQPHQWFCFRALWPEKPRPEETPGSRRPGSMGS